MKSPANSLMVKGFLPCLALLAAAAASAEPPRLILQITVDALRGDRPVTPYDIAPSLSALVGINEPSGSTGSPLAEVLMR